MLALSAGKFQKVFHPLGKYAALRRSDCWLQNKVNYQDERPYHVLKTRCQQGEHQEMFWLGESDVVLRLCFTKSGEACFNCIRQHVLTGELDGKDFWCGNYWLWQRASRRIRRAFGNCNLDRPAKTDIFQPHQQTPISLTDLACSIWSGIHGSGVWIIGR